MLEELKKEICEYNLELPRRGLVVMTSGNVSGRDPDSNLVVIKPSGVKYATLQPEDLVVVDLNGKKMEGKLRPSVDTESHLYVYRNRPDVFGVCHTHSTFASVFAALGVSSTTGASAVGASSTGTASVGAASAGSSSWGSSTFGVHAVKSIATINANTATIKTILFAILKSPSSLFPDHFTFVFAN